MRLLLSGIIALREGELRVRLDDAPRRANAATNLGGKNVNRYPASKDSDDWGVIPDAGYEVALTDEELKQYKKDRAARDVLNSEATPSVEFQDRQLQKALEYVVEQLRHK